FHTRDVLKALVGRSGFEGGAEEFTALAEALFSKPDLREGEAESLHPALLLYLGEEIVRSEPRDYPDLISRFHRLRAVRPEGVSLAFSPLEKVLRASPDGTYQAMSRPTQIAYRKAVLRYARKKKKSPADAAAELLETAKKSGKNLGFFLSKKKTYKAYYPLVISLFSLFFATFLLRTGWRWGAVALSLPLFYFARDLVRFCFANAVPAKPLYAMKPDVIGKENKTVVVIPCLVKDDKDVARFCKRIRKFAVNNRTENDHVYFGILCDLPESRQPEREEDKEIYEALEREIGRLNEKENVYFAVIRKRRYQKTERRYCGWERKRGALIRFSAYLGGAGADEDTTFFGNAKDLVGAKYLLTLDADTELGVDQARRLVAVAAHPVNRPVIGIKGGRRRVVSGYGILQPRMASSLLYPIETRYGKIFGNGAGRIPYASASFDPMQSLFSEGNFCGKGLIDVAAFNELIPPLLPENFVLSHDMPEGAVLRCGLVTCEFFTDSEPQDPKAEAQRLHRWIRGDTQNLFILGRLPFRRRVFAWEQFFSYLLPLFEVALLMLGAAKGGAAALLSLCLVLLFHLQGLLITCLNVLFTGNVEHFSRRFSTRIRNLVLNEIYRYLFSLSELVFSAVLQTSAVIVSLYRALVSKKHLLQWKTFDPSTKSKRSLLRYLPAFILSILCAAFSLKTAVCPLFIWTAFYPVFCEFLALPYKKRAGWNENQKRELLEMARREFAFFERTVDRDTRFLPPDNLQLRPTENVAMRTSPTNIGLYLASLLAACDLGFIGREEMLTKLAETISTVEKLEKSGGNLYNWYDLETLSVIGDGFVSTVDSGNFLASLITVASGLREIAEESPAAKALLLRIEKLIGETDLSVLFKPDRGLFSVGITPGKESGAPCYDLYMSECRITSFLAVALGTVSARHWQNLGRPILSFRGRVGAASWSGTAFEYFMAPLFLPIVKNSFEDESLSFALYAQKNYAVRLKNGKKIFGISESAFSETDGIGNYKYRAFGVPYLSLEGRKDEGRVLAPYASFLMLERGDPAVLENLQAMEKIGLCGECGYYDAVSFEAPGGVRSVVYSYMAHHKAMSLLALDNALRGNVLQERFMSYRDLAAKIDLLAERFPLEGRVAERRIRRERKEKPPFRAARTVFPVSRQAKEAFSVSDGSTTLLSDDAARVRVKSGEADWWRDFSLTFSGPWGETSLTDPEASVKIEIIPSGCVFFLNKGSFQGSVRIELLPDEGAVICVCERYGKRDGTRCAVGLAPLLCQEKEYLAHPAFSDLSRVIAREGSTLSIRRRTFGEDPRLTVKTPLCYALFSGSRPAAPSFPERVLQDEIRMEFKLDESKSQRVPLLFVWGDRDRREDLTALLDGSYNMKSAPRERMRELDLRWRERCGYGPGDTDLERRVICSLYQPRKLILSSSPAALPVDTLWKRSVSGDHPVVTVSVRDPEDLKRALSLLGVAKKCALTHTGFDLVLIPRDGDLYGAPLKRALEKRIREIRAGFLMDRSPGIHLISDAADGENENWKAVSRLFFGGKADCPVPQEIKSEVVTGKNGPQHAETVGRLTKEAFVLDRFRFDPGVPFSHVCAG
ncbi:MAG: hypothetical protein II776_01880, partial [Clostridia bacterium]|nr:hypothetical protein [Clostridia bacterium]